MLTTVSSITTFLRLQPSPDAGDRNLSATLDDLLGSEHFRSLLIALVEGDPFSDAFGVQFSDANAVAAVAPCRMLRGSLNLPLRRFFALLSQAFEGFESFGNAAEWRRFADRVDDSKQFADRKTIDYLTNALPAASARTFYAALAVRLEHDFPQAIYPTSDYRESGGAVASASDDLTIEAVMRVSTFATIKIVDRSLDIGQTVLRDIYKSLGRCICVVDENVESLYGERLSSYFAHYGISLHKRVFRANESDKSIATVERMLGAFKALGVSRNEPVLVVGGGVLADTAGLACALYGRNTPYVMLATSIVTAIDAGPSPRTCCDGFGYKNLLGAYHPPVVSITDRYFFETLRDGWVRHGIAEILKMAVVKDAQLFADLETAGSRLIETRFGTSGCGPGDPIQRLSQKILGGALRSYVAAEYDNLYETHQCRPHAYGHTWSPGFELETGLLHGHAVAICMGFGAYLSRRSGWIDDAALHRILDLMSGFGLSLRHDVLDRKETIWKSQQIVVQKRGNNLVAPLPKGEIGNCGYLNELTRRDLYDALDEYKAICARYPRRGYGIDAYCSDVGLEHPAATMPVLTA